MRTLAPFAPLLVCGVLAVIAACGGTSSSVADADAGSRADAAGNAEGGTDGGALDGTSDRDARFDGAPDPSSSLTVVLGIDALFQSCMPIVSPDPVVVQGNIKITNAGSSPVGAIEIKGGAFLHTTTSAVMATFELDTTTQVIAPGASTEALLEKTPSTMKPQKGCQTVPCNTDVVVELSYTGPGVPAGAVVRAPMKKMSCAF